MSCLICGYMLNGAITERSKVQVSEQRFALTKHHWCYSQMDFVDITGADVLSDRFDAAAYPHILAASCCARSFQCGSDAIRHEMEGGPSKHFDRFASMMCEYECRRVIRRLVAPPALPLIIGPLASDRSEHVSAKNEGSDAVHRPARVRIICSGLASAFPCISRNVRVGKNHWKSSSPRLPSGMSEALFEPGRETVERHAETGNSHFRH